MIPEVLAVRHNNDDGCGDVLMTSDDYAMSTSHVLGSTYLFAFLATTFPSIIDPGKRVFCFFAVATKPVNVFGEITLIQKSMGLWGVYIVYSWLLW